MNIPDDIAALQNIPAGPGWERAAQKLLAKLRAMPAGIDRIRAAHAIVTSATEAAERHRAEIDEFVAVLLYRYGWKKARLARASGIAVVVLFRARVVLPEPPADLVMAEAEAEENLTTAAAAYRSQQGLAKDAREVRRDDIQAMYLGHLDGKLWETGEVGRKVSTEGVALSDSLVKADLTARDIERRPASGHRVATPDGPAAPLADIARMMHVAPNRLKDAVQAAKRGNRFPTAAMEGDLYVPRAVAQWWPTTERASKRAYGPKGEQLATLARRYGLNYQAAKTAVRYAEERAGTPEGLPAGVHHDDGTFDEEKFLTWWRARAEMLEAGTTLKAIAEDLRVDYGWLRDRIKAYKAKHGGALPDGVQLPYRRWDKDKFVAEVWPTITGS
ncbi:hypothetical protein ABT352_32795 [Streptosporangium sp. NPDC000563]|uniref:hypothetical protein n=1 Tax=Streptosporangium sp. NPDC000563 TaxID=3154366 RepID=UPI0033209D1A